MDCFLADAIAASIYINCTMLKTSQVSIPWSESLAASDIMWVADQSLANPVLRSVLVMHMDTEEPGVRLHMLIDSHGQLLDPLCASHAGAMRL